MRHLKNILIGALIGLSFLGCTRGEQASDDPTAVFLSLWQEIDQRYCFLDYKQETIGLDWDEVYRRYKGRINREMNSQQLFEVLCEMLGELQDGHVNLYSARDMGRNWSWHEDFPKNLDEEVREGYLGTGNDYRMTGGLKYRILPDNVGYLVCTSFSTIISDVALDYILHDLRACNGLIIDVRGNGGGELTNAERLASRFTNERIVVGYQIHKTGPGHNEFSTPEPKYLEPSRSIRWQKPCVVLTNRRCYSATNDFVCSMKQCPQVTILGDQTGGGSGMPFMCQLPNGWTMRYSACPILDAEMQHTEFGIQPDILCSLNEQDALQGIDTMIEEARKVISTK